MNNSSSSPLSRVTRDSVQSRLPSFLRPYFGDRSTSYSTISIITSILSILVSIFLVAWPEQIPWLLLVRDVMLFLILLTAALFWFGKYVRQELRFDELKSELKRRGQEVEALKDQTQNFHDIVHDFRNVTFQTFSPQEAEFDTLSTQEELKAFEKICDTVTSRIKENLKTYFRSRQIDLGTDLCVTVKMRLKAEHFVNLYRDRIPNEKSSAILGPEHWMITVYRDPETWATRQERKEAGQTVYEIHENTAFMHLFISNARSYACDDLIAEKRKGNYKNENPRWHEQYNSTLVVPIRFRNDKTNDTVHFGVLAVDSLNPEGYQLFEGDSNCFHIMAHGADMLAEFFLALVLYRL